MNILYDPDTRVDNYKFTRCHLHTLNPSSPPFAGCCCSASFGTRDATPEEYRVNRINRLTRLVDDLKQQLAVAESQLRAVVPTPNPGGPTR